MRDTGILGVVLPELLEGVGVAQGSFHCYDVFTHSLYACDAAPRESLVLRLAALLHDIGKASNARRRPRRASHFYSHEKVSAEMAEASSSGSKLPNAVMKDVCHLVAHHMFNYQEEWSDAAVRRLIARVGEAENRWTSWPCAGRTRLACAGRTQPSFPQGSRDFAARVRSVLRREGIQLSQLAVNGNDIMKTLGIPPGPVVGVILNELLQAVLEDPALNEKEKLLEIARQHAPRTAGRLVGC